MYIQKLKNGHYRNRLTERHKTCDVTIDHKPTKKEAEELLHVSTSEKSGTLYSYVKKYIDAKSEVLSPSTLRDYTKTIERLHGNYKLFDIDIRDIGDYNLQLFINEYAKTHSPKTTKNIYSLVAVVLRMFKKSYIPNISLPQRIKKTPYIPTDEDIKKLLQYSKNTEYEIPIKLLLYGLRMSELYALTIDDIKDGEIIINKARVRGPYGYTIKTTKTVESTRIITVDKDLTSAIHEKGYIINMHQGAIARYLYNLHKEKGLPHFSPHKLRHYFCSVLSLYANTPYILKAGGWSSDYVMKSVYQHSIKDYSKETIEYMKKLDK